MGETKGKGSKSKGKGFKEKKGSQTSQASTGSGGKGPPNKKPASPGPKGSGKGNMNKGRAPILGRGSDRPHHGNFLTENQARSALAKARPADPTPSLLIELAFSPCIPMAVVAVVAALWPS